MSEGAKLKQEMLDGGAPAHQVEEWATGLRKQMIEGGAPPEEVAKYWGDKPEPDMSKAQAIVSANMEGMTADEVTKVAETPIDMIQAGLQMSVSGLMVRGRKPDTILSEDAGMMEKILYGAGMLAGDMPAIITGTVAGGAVGGGIGTAVAPGPGTVAGTVIGAGAGGFGLPEHWRLMLMDQYDHPNGSKTWDETFSRVANIIRGTTNSMIVGAAAGPAGGKAGQVVLGKTGSKVGAGVANMGTMAVTATAVGSALEGHVPTADDFITGAVLAIGFHAAGTTIGATKRFVPSSQGKQVAANLRTIYEKTGIPPVQAVRQAIGDPALKSEILAPTDARGVRLTPAHDAERMPEPPAYRQEPKVEPKEVERQKPVIARDGWGELIQKLETGVMRDPDNAVSHAGAIGRNQIMPDTARQYGYDPARLRDPRYNDMVRDHILADLDVKFGGDLEAVLIAYNAGPRRARAFLRAGRDRSMLPVETQGYLERAEKLGWLDRGNREAQVDRALKNVGDDGAWQPEGLRPRDWGVSQQIALEETLARGWKDINAVRVLPDGNVVPAPEAVATYLQKFGKLAGFKFAVAPANTSDLAIRTSQEVGPQVQATAYKMPGEPPKKSVLVTIPENTDAIARRWWGLGNYEVIMHEVGHALDKHLLKDINGTQFIPEGKLKEEMIATSKKFRSELWKAQPEYNMKPSELMADNIAMWISDPTMRPNMKEFSKLYEEKLEPFIELANQALPKRQGENWVPPGGGKDAGGEGGGGGGEPPVGGRSMKEPPERPKKIETDRMKLGEEELRDKILEIVAPEVKAGVIPDWMNPRKLWANFQGQLTPARKLDKKVGIKPGDERMGIEDMLRQTYASKDRAGYFIRYGVLDAITLERTSDASFLAAFKAVKEDGGDLAGFQAYRLAARTVEKARQGIETGVDLEVARKYLNEPGVREKYERGSGLMRAAKDGSIEYAKDSGVFTKAQAAAIKNLNREHIVMRRIMDPQYNPPRPGSGFRTRQPVRKMKGSDREIVDPMTADIDNLHTIIAMADRNRALGNIIGAIEAHNAKLAKGDKLRIEFGRVDWDMDTGRVLKSEILDENGRPIPQAEKEAAAPFIAHREAEGWLARHKGRTEDHFIYFREGKPELWKAADPELAELLRSIWTGKPDPIPNLLTQIASLQRAGITSSFEFPFRAILIHGQLAGTALAERGSVAPYHDIMKGFMSVIKRDEHYKRWVANGGAGSALTDMDVRYVQRDAQMLFEKTGTHNAVWNTVLHPVHAMRNLQHMMDAAARVGFMRRNEASGLNTLKAATLSRKAYIDFGEPFAVSWVNTWGRMVPFMHAGFKDIEQFTRAMRDRPISSAMKAFAILTMPTMLNYMVNYLQDQTLPEERRYSNQPQWMRDMYWVLPEINGVRMKIIRPYGVGYAFATMPERFMDFLVRDMGEKAFTDLAKTFTQQIIPPTVPTLMVPLVEDVTNYSLFTGRPLIPASLEEASGWMQYTPDTSETAKKLAQVIGPPGLNLIDASPMVIQNYARQWLGTMPMTILKVLEAPFHEGSRPREWLTADNPFVGAFFVRNPIGGQSVEEFYDGLKELKAGRRDLQLAIERQDMSQIETASRWQAAVQLTEFETEMRNMRAVLNAIYADKNMTDDEKRKYTDSISSGMVAVAKAGVKLLDELKKTEP